MNNFVPTLIICLGKLGGKIGEGLVNTISSTRTKVVALDSDVTFLNALTINTIHIGANRREGLGCAENPELGKKALNDDLEVVQELVESYQKIIILGGLGKGFATGAAIALSEYFRRSKKIVIFMLTTPFSTEGLPAAERSEQALEVIRKNIKSVICLSNDLLYSQIAADTAIAKAFELATKYISQGVHSLVSLLQEGYRDTITIEFSTISQLLEEKKSECAIAYAKSETQDFEQLAQEIIESPMSGGLTFIQKADFVLIKVSGGGLNIKALNEGLKTLATAFDCANSIRYGAQFCEEEKPLEISCLFISYRKRAGALINGESQQLEFESFQTYQLGEFSGRAPVLLDQNGHSFDIPTFQRLNFSFEDLN